MWKSSFRLCTDSSLLNFEFYVPKSTYGQIWNDQFVKQIGWVIQIEPKVLFLQSKLQLIKLFDSREINKIILHFGFREESFESSHQELRFLEHRLF